MSKQPAKPKVVPIGNRGDQILLMIQAMADVLKRRGDFNGRLGRQYGDKRDLYNVLGYTRTPSVDDYWQYFLREDIAKRIISAPVTAIWRQPPEICETDNPDRETEFEKAWDTLVKTTNVWNRFARADRLAGVGHYGIMILGVKGSLNTEVKPGTLSAKKGGKLLFLSTYSQRHANVDEYEESTSSDRFGKPLFYKVDIRGDMMNAAERFKATKRSANEDLQSVHWSRVLHFAEGLLEDEVHGTPRLEPVFNRLYDVQKIAGGSAEMYWRGAWGGFALETTKDAISGAALSGSIDKDIVDDYAHGMRRWLDLEGYTMKQIQGQDVKPKEVFEVLISLISSATSIPQRILLGSERGQLASVQDETNWKDFIEGRREDYAEPLVREFIDRLLGWGILPEPKRGDYDLEWPSLYTLTEKEKSEVFKNYADGISKVAPGGQVELIATPKEIRTQFLEFDADPEPGLEIDPATVIEPDTQVKAAEDNN